MTRRRRWWLAIVALGAPALVAAACGSGAGRAAEPDPPDRLAQPAGTDPQEAPGATGGAPDPGPTGTSPPAAEPPSVPEALDFTAPRIGGGQVVGADYAGQAVVMWFWAPW